MRYFVLLTALLVSLGVSQAQALSVTTKTNAPLETVCAVTKNLDIYGTLEYQLKDAFNSDGKYIISSLSTVSINTFGNKVSIDSNFSQPSNYAPGPGSYTVAWQNGKTKLNLSSLTPADRGTTIAQVVYRIRRVPAGPGVTPAVQLVSVPDLGPNVFPGAAITYGLNTQSFNPSAATEDNECQNIQARWCGDGVVDSGNGETCDNGSANGTPGNSCTATCGRAPFDLMLKKYVAEAGISSCGGGAGCDDAQTAATAARITSGTPYVYVFRVTNNGAVATTSTTAVSDVSLPTGVSLTAVPTGNGWTCGYAVGGFTCVRSDSLAPGASYPDIVATVVHTGALPSGALQNTATVVNPDENPANNYGNNNSDPANVTVLPPTVACVTGGINPVLAAPITSASPGLCQVGATVGNFTAVQNPSTGVFTYTWSCNNSAVGGACSAQFNPTPTSSFDLSLKKYATTLTSITGCGGGAGCDDAQTAVSAVPVTAGANYSYVFRVTNNGPTSVTNTTKVADVTFPAGVQLVGTPTGSGWTCNRVSVGFECSRSDSLASGASYPDIVAIANVPSSTSATYTNTATVSNPDENPANNYGNNNSDPANVRVGTVVSTLCQSLTVAPTTSSAVPFSTTLTCTAGSTAGTNPTYQISCGNGQVINGRTGTCTYTAFGSQVAKCSVNGEADANIPAACQTTITAQPPGGGGPGSCEQLSFTPVSNVNNTYSVSVGCTATAAAGSNPTYEISCGNGTTISGASGICQYATVGSTSFPYTAECRVNGSTQGSPGAPGIMAPGSCRQSISLSSGAPLPGGGLCGNGVIDVSSGEQCDTGLTSGNSLCTSTCRLNTSGSTNPSACARGLLDCPNGFTTPGSSPIEILFKRSGASPRPVSTYKWIVGNNVPVFEAGDSFTLTAPFPVLLSGGKAAVSSTSEHLNGTVTEFTLPNNCIGQGSINYGSGNIPCDPAGIILFTADANGKLLPSSGGGAGMNFSGNTARISGASADVNPLTSPGSAVYQNNFAINVGYLFEPLWVRVSKPAVSNTAGGNAYLGAQVGASVNSITEDFLNSLKKGNFTVTSTTRSGVATFGAENATGTKQAGTTNLSKFSDAPSSTPEQTIVIDSMDDFEAALASGKFTKTGDAKGLYVLKKGTVTLRSTPGSSELRLKGIGTLLIEEGTLIIETDVEYEDANSSWAFIVKKPKTSSEPAIQVASSVTQISGAYLALSGEMTGNGPSTRPLAVDGNVNANIAKLVSDRTFIRANEGSSALSTGVTINYSTRAFKNPPPLLSQYLEQYNLEKISR